MYKRRSPAHPPRMSNKSCILYCHSCHGMDFVKALHTPFPTVADWLYRMHEDARDEKNVTYADRRSVMDYAAGRMMFIRHSCQDSDEGYWWDDSWDPTLWEDTMQKMLKQRTEAAAEFSAGGVPLDTIHKSHFSLRD